MGDFGFAGLTFGYGYDVNAQTVSNGLLGAAFGAFEFVGGWGHN